jgi:gluconate 5-dehydrogenase
LSIISELFSLHGKVAIVTGGAGHLGYYISLALAEAGADVYMASPNKKKCQDAAGKISKETGANVKGIYIDISSMEKVIETLALVAAERQRIDILVNNGSISSGKALNMEEKEWLKGLDGTINGVFRTTQAVIPYMVKSDGGSIINIASMYGIVSPDSSIYNKPEYTNPPNYGAGKAAIIQFTRYAACHLAEKGIRVNAISPGPFPTTKVQEDKEFIANLEKKVPLGRIGRPREIKGIIIYLASEASSYVTGTNICIDGGWTAW